MTKTIALIIIFSTVLLLSCGKDLTPDQRIVRIRHLVDEKKYNEAIEHMDILKIERPTDKMFLYFAAIVYDQLNQIDSSLSYAKKASALYPRDHEIVKFLYIISEKAQDWNAQMEAVNLLSSIEGNREKYYFRIAELNLLINMPGMSVKVCRTILETDPENTDVRFLLAASLFACENYDSAVAVIEELNAQIPNQLELINNLATYLSHAGRFDEAIVQYQKLLVLFPDYIPARFGLAHTFVRNGDTAKAMDEYYGIYLSDSTFYGVDSILRNLEQSFNKESDN